MALACLALLLALEGTAEVTGSVTDEQGAPASARVFIRNGEDVQSVATGPKGGFEATLLPPGNATLSVCRPGSWPEELPLELKPGTRVRVSLVLRDVRPGDAIVMCKDEVERPTATAPAERMSMRMLERAPKYEPLNPHLAVRSAQVAQHAPSRIFGVVTFAGKPVPRARIQLRRGEEGPLLQEQAADAHGRFAFESLEARAYDVEIGAAEGSRLLGNVTPVEPFELQAELQPPRHMVRVCGVVHGPDGRPEKRALVRGWTSTVDWGAPSTPEHVHGGPSGEYCLSFVDFGTAEVEASLPGGFTAKGRLEFASHDARLDLFAEAKPAAVESACMGSVVGPNGEATAGVTVSSSWSPSSGSPLAFAVTGADGRFQLPAAEDGEAWIRARGALGVAQAPCKASSELRLVLRRGATLQGTISSHVGVHLLVLGVLPALERGASGSSSAEPMLSRRFFAFRGASFQVTGLPVNQPVDLWVWADDGRGLRGSVVLPAEGVFGVDLSFDGTGTLALTPSTSALVCLDRRPASLADCLHVSESGATWPELVPGGHVLWSYAPDALPWLEDAPHFEVPVKLVGGEVTRVEGVEVPPARGAPLWLLRDSPEGVVVDDVAPGGPADKAGLGRGAIVIAIQGTPVKKASDAHQLARGFAGSVIEVSARRLLGEVKTFRLTLAPTPSPF